MSDTLSYPEAEQWIKFKNISHPYEAYTSMGESDNKYTKRIDVGEW